MINTDAYVNFIINNNLTQDQYLLLHLLYESRRDLIKKYKEKYPTPDDRMISEYFIKDLIDRGFIVKTKTGHKLGQNFLRIFIDANTATDEIFELYPPFIRLNGVDVPLTTMDRKVFAEIYVKKINGSLEAHQEIMKDLQYAIDNDLIKTGINKFLTSEQWKGFRKLRCPPPSPLTTESIMDINDDF